MPGGAGEPGRLEPGGGGGGCCWRSGGRAGGRRPGRRPGQLSRPCARILPTGVRQCAFCGQQAGAYGASPRGAVLPAERLCGQQCWCSRRISSGLMGRRRQGMYVAPLAVARPSPGERPVCKGQTVGHGTMPDVQRFGAPLTAVLPCIHLFLTPAGAPPSGDCKRVRCNCPPKYPRMHSTGMRGL